LTRQDRIRDFLNRGFAPMSILRSGAAAGLGQVREVNPEWDQGMEGYSLRFASKYGHRLVRLTLESTSSAFLGQDLRYEPSRAAGFWPRTGHALTRVFVARKNDGSHTFASSRFGAAFGAGLISRTWHPRDDRTIGSGLRSGATSIGISAGMNVVREFWPEIRKLFGR
jgi:hypothetical protein